MKAGTASIALALATLLGCTQQGKDSGPDSGNTMDVDAAVPVVDSGPPLPDGAVPVDAAMRDSGVAGTTNNVRIIVEPSDNAAGLLSAIQGATRSVHMTMYLLSSTSIIQALIDRHKNGVEVKVILNQTFPPNGGDNNSVFTQLQSAGVPVVWASASFTYTHEKCVIIDGTSASIMTMNATQTSARDNREYLAVDLESDDIAEAENIFAADYAHTGVVLGGKLLVAPNNARTKLVAFIGTARSTIDVEGEEFSDTQIANALMTAASSGAVKVRVVVSDESPTTAQTAAIATVKAKGVTVVATATPTIHAKAMVVDGTRAYVGSANFSGGSLGYNREVGIILGNAPEVAKITAAINTDYAAGVRQ